MFPVTGFNPAAVTLNVPDSAGPLSSMYVNPIEDADAVMYGGGGVLPSNKNSILNPPISLFYF
jgi:hypothetical protein